MKKLTSLFLALILVLAMAAPAMADGSTTISVASDDAHTYEVYQIFTGDLAADKKTLSNVVWGKNGTGYIAAEEGKEEIVTPVDAAILNALVAVTNAATDAAKLNVIETYVDFDSTAIGTVSASTPITVTTGYYLLKDLGVKQADGTYEMPAGDEYNLFVVQIVGDTTVTSKRDTVTSQKKVDDKNDSETTEDAVVWQDSADYDIGDEVPFQLTGTVTGKYDNYSTYYYAFHDVESAGLDFNSDTVKVYVDGVEITNPTEGEPYYKVVTNTTDGCTFEIVFEDLKDIAAVKADSTIVVTYTSTLNENAVLGAEGNPNTMHIEYSNNPNWDGKGEQETGETPDDKVIVFTYKVVVNKVTKNSAYDANKDPEKTGTDSDDDKEYIPLENAGFTLYKKNASGEWSEVIDGDPDTDNEIKGTELTTFEWRGLDDGDYKLVETTTPAGYNTIADIEFTISASHDVKADNPELTSLTGEAETGEVFTIVAETYENGEGTEDDTTSANAGLSTNVVNNAGKVLPETGGMGTTILYVGGGLLIAAALILLVAKKRTAASK